MRRHIVFTVAIVIAGMAMSSTTFARGGHGRGSMRAAVVGVHRAPAARMASSPSGRAVVRAAPRADNARVPPIRHYLYSRPIVPYYSYGLGWYDDPFWYGAPWPWPYAGYAYSESAHTGGLRLKVEPGSAQVYVDGYYAGIVNDFNGHFQQLKMTPSGHRIELRAPGYEPLAFDVYVQRDHTTEWHGTMVPSQANG